MVDLVWNTYHSGGVGILGRTFHFITMSMTILHCNFPGTCQASFKNNLAFTPMSTLHTRVTIDLEIISATLQQATEGIDL